MPLVTDVRDIAYTQDASALFYTLAQEHDSVLLESADIESKKNVNCLAVLKAALKVTCQGQRVTATPLTPTGEEMFARLTEQLAEFFDGEAFVFSPSAKTDERERLRDVSTVEVLRRLQLDAGYRSEMLPLVAGGFAYDYLGTFEVLPEVVGGPNDYPDYEFVVAETLLTVDHLARDAKVYGVGIDADALARELDSLVTVTKLEDIPVAPNRAVITAQTDVDDHTFRANVTQLQKNIDAGDIYQVVPARSFTLDCPDAFAAYRQLRETNPSPYMFYVRGGDYELFGASPESNLKFDAAARQVQLYPIAGTRPRGLNPDGTINHELDIRNELEMRTDTKEVSEHTMLVDLARNDLARVAAPRTRRVADLLQVDRYSRVMHLVSRVVATLHEDFDALDAYRACMNMGTLTGAPKLRATELVRQTEGMRRGSYGGAVGYLKGDGSMDNCIVIRSAYVKNGTAVVQAGAGVVRDSIPQSEADETLHKAFAVLNAIAQAHNAQLEVVR
ncbi:anthranilate synthase component 1 [uncultured Corynebacterium sp.]|uniref:anthranilate synthase component 1 n=1 Tax=uncultured Corynebacterium sp. TaxID=159447 RepID=UPI0025F4B7EA|nr:anthranilate synthase component 1 [uncultured Corynebacterium sp.]